MLFPELRLNHPSEVTVVAKDSDTIPPSCISTGDIYREQSLSRTRRAVYDQTISVVYRIKDRSFFTRKLSEQRSRIVEGLYHKWNEVEVAS